MPQTIPKTQLAVTAVQISQKPNLVDEKIAALKASIQENGLIHPIAVNSNHELVAGFHRFEAFRQLAEEQPQLFEKIPVRIINEENAEQLQQLETTEKLFRPDLSILEKAEYFKAYFDRLKYGETKYKTTTIFRTLDISRRTFFNLRAIAEQLNETVREKVKNLSHTGLPNSTPQLLALCKYREDIQLQLLQLMEQESYQTLFDAIKAYAPPVEPQEETTVKPKKKLKKKKYLKSPTLKLTKELRQELRHISRQTQRGQNELFNEIFEAGLEVIQQKYL